MSTTKTRALNLSKGNDRAFVHLLVNTLLVSVINFTVWFAITFWVFLETKSVLATGMVAGIFLVATALSGIWFGSLVDHYRKKTTMQVSSLVSLAFYAVAFTLYQLTSEQTSANPASVMLWVFIVLSMFGVIAGNIRSIALMTLVTLLIPEDRRDRANGLVGTTLGVSFLVTSVISGLLVAAGGMFYVLLLGMVALGLSVVHLALVRVEERPEDAATPDVEPTNLQPKQHKVDLRGTLRIVRGVPGLLALIGFACFNNFLGDLAGSGYGHLHAVGTVRRGVGADRPSKGRALRAARPGLWLRPECRAGGLAADGVSHRADHAADLHPVHDDRCGCRYDRRLVRHWAGPWHRTGFRPARAPRPRCHHSRALQPALSAAQHTVCR